jgi:hypothetical protein
MLRLLADENLNHDLIRGLLRRMSALDLLRVQDVGLRAVDDPSVLEWAALEGRIVVTHDVNTMPAFAFDRIRRNQRMPGMFVINQQAALATVIDDIFLIMECSENSEWDGRVIFLPLQ